ncbi:hypothetical protein B0T26DRAFT_719270 [Lasiosphaeria miniovina]|uniref:G domain-containing protein n=1 Tax=Lasiosphaeria miniovina TaxID=1954250 RepID=A0AA40ADQ0_9PEZI|nr:uncharacterized protein B0T26DRAFT_719270 [Lasiosphaeria miniovina]KAK0714014.1 hypothetical protein B0T26DRAFT_719270 [Lasiosphaeria miniovina]
MHTPCRLDRYATEFILVDTPGFNDTNRDDLDILRAVANFIASSPAIDIPPVAGVVLTHNITQNRVTGSARLNLAVLKALVQEERARLHDDQARHAGVAGQGQTRSPARNLLVCDDAKYRESSPSEDTRGVGGDRYLDYRGR